jgi:Xaa-Pro aminopeptidase
MFQTTLYKERRAKLKTLVKSGLLFFMGNNDSPMNYPANTYAYRQDSTFLYFFGLSMPGLSAVIDIDSGKEIIFGNDNDIDDIIWMGPQPSIKELAATVGVEETSPVASLSQILSSAQNSGRKIHYLPPYRAENMLRLFSILGIHPDHQKEKSSVEFVEAVVSLRNIKDSYEIEHLDSIMDVAWLMHTTAMRMARPGIYEREIAGAMEGIALANGGAVSFPVILSKRGETLHNHHHGNILNKGDLMLADAGFQSAMGYATDHTRTIPVGGEFSVMQKEIYQIVLNANNAGIENARPGVTYQSVHLTAARTIASGLKELGLMKGDVDEAVAAGAHALFFPHGLGHMMGLDVHDMEDLGENLVGYGKEVTRSGQFGTAYLRLGRTLKPGFVLTVEPGIYFIPALIDLWKSEGKHSAFIQYDKVELYRNFGGIRLEDDLLITDSGNRLLGKKRIPIEPSDVEAMVLSK